jgi:hypothetical protein
MPTSAPHGLPARAALDATGLHVALLDIAADELRDPFLHETVQRVPAAQTLVHVPQAELGRIPAASAPAGVIFHVARCGSTLVSQLLKLHEDLVVYAEPLAFNELLVPPHASSRATLVAAVRSLGSFFAAHAGRPYVLKLSSWNTLFCDVVVEAFPDTPWALCIRDPLEVCVSLLQTPPSWLRANHADRFLPVVDPARVARHAEDRVARFFAAFCEAACGLDPGLGRLVPYDTLPSVVWDRLAPHFGLGLTDSSRQRMAAASRLDAKSPLGQSAAFAPDVERKRALASPALRDAVDKVAWPMYQRLLRRLGPAGHEAEGPRAG